MQIRNRLLTSGSELGGVSRTEDLRPFRDGSGFWWELVFIKLWFGLISVLRFKSKKKTIRDLNLSDFLQLKSSGILKSPVVLAFAKHKCVFHWLSQEELDRPLDPQGADGDRVLRLGSQGPGSGPSHGWWHRRLLCSRGPAGTHSSRSSWSPGVHAGWKLGKPKGQNGTRGRVDLQQREQRCSRVQLPGLGPARGGPAHVYHPCMCHSLRPRLQTLRLQEDLPRVRTQDRKPLPDPPGISFPPRCRGTWKRTNSF